MLKRGKILQDRRHFALSRSVFFGNFSEISGYLCVFIMDLRVSTTSATSDSDVDDHDAEVLMANDTITVCINERHKTYMKACCSEGCCFAKFKDMDTRLLESDPEALFSNIHENDNNIFVTSCPLTKKWSEFLFDVFNWKTHELFEENYVTELDVNRHGKGKIYAAWRVMDQYRGRYRSKNLTRNVVDIRITIPDANVIISDHFCYKYFRKSAGSPYTTVPTMLKPVMDKLYDRYFVDMSLANLSKRIHFTCAYCSHDETSGPKDRHIKSIPKWYLKELYTTTNRVSKFNLISYTCYSL